MDLTSFFTKLFFKLIKKGGKEAANQLGNRGGIIKKENEYGRDIPINQKFALILIHGFGGEKEDTWDRTPDFLTKDPDLKHWDIFLQGYNTHFIPDLLKGLWVAAPPIEVVGRALKDQINTLLNQGYKNISICAHSMGGLVTQSALLELPKAELAHIDAVMLFGTPSMGLNKAKLARRINRQLRDMSKGGGFITSLRDRWSQKFGQELPFKFLAIAGGHDEFVPRENALRPFPADQVKDISGDHLSIVKPKSPDDPIITTIKDKLLYNKNYRFKWEPALMAMAETDFAKAIEIYEDSGFDELDEANKVNYILALEATGKDEKAMEYAKKIVNSAETLSLLGGRFKRMYLSTGKVKFLEEAIESYTEAYEKALLTEVVEDIFYPAINLTFLYLKKKDLVSSKEFATIARNYAEKSELDNQWKYATLGEAYLTLKEPQKAIESYEIAAKKPGKLRDKESMLIHAIETTNILGWTETEQERIVSAFK